VVELILAVLHCQPPLAHQPPPVSLLKHLHEVELILTVLQGGALEKWQKFKNALMVLRTGNKLVMVFFDDVYEF
jgi:hypothetical protein